MRRVEKQLERLEVSLQRDGKRLERLSSSKTPLPRRSKMARKHPTQSQYSDNGSALAPSAPVAQLRSLPTEH